MTGTNLEVNKAYRLEVPENETSGKVGYLGETYTERGKLFYWVYEHLPSNKKNMLMAISLEEGNFICDGNTISPVPGTRWGSVNAVVDLNKKPRREKTSRLVAKLKDLGVVPQNA